ncbi:uncharacterized protein GLRG_00434 [Colletotrichum graminicola M1.001]|uniref:Uncharacterized protein n=1 Tax=Colletotrichum graminicola (strain M1.001 / M2 / FGSC 10212) TaxID=645133 RepID=E3Q2I9_COLGM|nr:uncharacterized protein GLRG_00434 [Colletotrichum graminicola M1.001]EFQ25290.1 hypothetical protein GLRG_00434 [Colletotrichum graminicola M1.001]
MREQGAEQMNPPRKSMARPPSIFSLKSHYPREFPFPAVVLHPTLELLPAHRRPTSALGSYEDLAMIAPAAPVYETRAAGAIDADVPSG